MEYLNLNNEDLDNFNAMVMKCLSSMIPIAVRGPDGRFVYANHQFLSQLDLTPEDVVGKGSAELIQEYCYESSSSEKAFLTKQDKDSKAFSHINEWIYSENKIIKDDQGNIKYVITYCVRPNEILEEVNKLHAYLKRYRTGNNFSEMYSSKTDKKVVFASKEMTHLLTQASKIAQTDASILITGESGVGKDIVAKMIHNNSNRKDKPFVPISIPQMSSTLIESELFGYERGSFTGASNAGRVGLCEMANGGTVLLDEIGDIPLELQVKLLRVLENREVNRIGSTKSIQLDVRFIVATNKALKEMAQEGKFREDLLFRIGIVHLHVKPLRERKDDIIPLTDSFITSFNKRYHMQRRFSEEIYQAFLQHPWPGNIRQLRNAVERLILLADENYVTLDMLRTIINWDGFAAKKMLPRSYFRLGQNH